MYKRPILYKLVAYINIVSNNPFYIKDQSAARTGVFTAAPKQSLELTV